MQIHGRELRDREVLVSPAEARHGKVLEQLQARGGRDIAGPSEDGAPVDLHRELREPCRDEKGIHGKPSFTEAELAFERVQKDR